jgi:tetratricopeptide (TPR) repeat protein
MKTIDFSYFIEKYSSGEMNDTEKQWFEKELEGNKKLRMEVDLRKHTDNVLKNQNIISLRSKLSEIEKRRAVNVPVSNSKKLGNLRYAAAVALLLIIGSVTLFHDKNLSNEDILNRYYKAYEPPTVQRSGSAIVNEDYSLALEFYNIHDYEKAAELFTKVLENNPRDMQSALLNGVSNFESNKYPEASSSFADVINDNNNLYIDQAQWYLALCYVRTDEKDKAVRQLETIKKGNGIHSKDATKILRKLK